MRLQRLLSILRFRLRAVFHRARVEQELDDEIRDHIDRRIAADVARGVAPDQARRAALGAFGGIAQSKEACREVRGVTMFEHTVQDLRFEPPTGILGLSALVVLFVIGVALLASWIPARGAARIDPLAALRAE